MTLDQPPAIIITLEKGGIKVDLRGEQPVRFGNGNIMFPSRWSEEKCDKWLDENTTPETRPGPRS